MVESVDSLKLLKEINKQAARCGRVIDVPLPGEPEAQLCALAQGVTDAQVLGCSITFTGLCKTCQQADKGSASE